MGARCSSSSPALVPGTINRCKINRPRLFAKINTSPTLAIHLDRLDYFMLGRNRRHVKIVLVLRASVGVGVSRGQRASEVFGCTYHFALHQCSYFATICFPDSVFLLPHCPAKWKRWTNDTFTVSQSVLYQSDRQERFWGGIRTAKHSMDERLRFAGWYRSLAPLHGEETHSHLPTAKEGANFHGFSTPRRQGFPCSTTPERSSFRP